jgi:hypothetical protein
MFRTINIKIKILYPTYKMNIKQCVDDYVKQNYPRLEAEYSRYSVRYDSIANEILEVLEESIKEGYVFQSIETAFDNKYLRVNLQYPDIEVLYRNNTYYQRLKNLELIINGETSDYWKDFVRDSLASFNGTRCLIVPLKEKVGLNPSKRMPGDCVIICV